MASRASKGRARRSAASRALDETVDPLDMAVRLAASERAEGPAHRLLETHERLARNELFRGRFRAARDIAVALLAIAALIGVVAAILSAAASRAVVIHAFTVPPALAERGLTGEVIAQRFIDHLLHVQRNADSVRAPASFADAWSGDLKAQIPTTGVSFGEAQGALRRWLGDETHVTGELTLDDGQIQVTARAPGSPPVHAGAPSAELDRAILHAAEEFFGQQQPYLLTVYLRSQGRGEEQDRVLRQLAIAGSPDEQAWAHNGLALNSRIAGRFEGFERHSRSAIAADPELPNPHYNLWILAIVDSGREGSFAEGDEVIARFRNAVRAGVLKAEPVNSLTNVIETYLAQLQADHGGAETLARQGMGLADYIGSRRLAIFRLAQSQAGLHRPREAITTLISFPVDPSETFGSFLHAQAHLRLTRMAVAAELGDWRFVLSDATAFDRWAAAQGGLAAAHRPVLVLPWIARALAETGDIAGADATIALTPRDCYFCLRVRGRIAHLAGRRTEIDRWYRAAIASAPDLPQAWHEWAIARLARGDNQGALAAAREAAANGPRWADPLALAGDALMRLGRAQEALEHYEQAAERAPRWGAMHIAWAQALWRAGRFEEARERLRAAATMDLHRFHRARLRRLARLAGS